MIKYVYEKTKFLSYLELDCHDEPPDTERYVRKICGHSMGGAITMALTPTSPELVQGLVSLALHLLQLSCLKSSEAGLSENSWQMCKQYI